MRSAGLLEDAAIVLYDQKLSGVQEIVPLLEHLGAASQFYDAAPARIRRMRG